MTAIDCAVSDQQPLITIVTVTWNCESTIDRTLASVNSLKTSDIEYIIIDGQSTDRTLEYISAYPGLVNQLVSEPDTGIYNAMNKGAKLARGEYILFLNGDDNLIKEGFNKAKQVLKNKRPDVLSCRCEAVSMNGEKLNLLVPSFWKIFFFNTIPHPSTFVTTELQKKYSFREQFAIAADYDLFLRLYLDKRDFVLSDLVIASHYRGGFSSNMSKSLNETRAIRREHLGMLRYSLSRLLEELNYYKYQIFNRLGVRRSMADM